MNLLIGMRWSDLLHGVAATVSLLDKTEEKLIDFRKSGTDIDGSTTERVKSTKFLGVHISDDLAWTLSITSIVKKVQQHIQFLQKLKKASLPSPGSSLPSPILTLLSRGYYGESLVQLHHCLAQELQHPATNSESSWEGNQQASTFPARHLPQMLHL